MQNRLYTQLDKSLFYDPENILFGAFEFCEIQGEEAGKVFEKLKDFYSDTHFKNPYENINSVKNAVIYARAGRRDRALKELEAVTATLKKADVSVKSGIQYYFADTVQQAQIDAFLKENVNPYVYICEVAGKPKEMLLAEENPVIDNFCAATYTELVRMRKKFDLGMAIDDLMCVQNYFISESREPSLVEIKIIDNFFSENFRHTTFETILDNIETDDEAVAQAWDHYRALRGGKSPSLSDITKAAKESINKESIVKATSKLSGVKIPTLTDEELLLLVKNESHNRSTTAVPYDGAAGCIGGAVKDLLCALGYPYDSYRVIGYGKNEKSRKKSLISSAGYAEAASAIGIPCSKCKETVSSNHDEKQREVCSVLALANKSNVTRVLEKSLQSGDKIYVIGSKTGADGTHCLYRNLKNKDSVGEYIPVTSTGELIALKRLFVSQEFADIAVAINDVSSGGIICALGEITEGADINIGALTTRYELSLSEAILSESGERMIVCVRAESGARLESLCKKRGLECCNIGTVSGDKRFSIYDNEKNRIASLTSAFLMSGGAEKHLSATIKSEDEYTVSEALVAAKAPLDSVNPIKKFFGKGIKYDFEKACLISAEGVEISRNELAHRMNRAAGGDTSVLDMSPLATDVSLRRLSYRGKDVLSNEGKEIYSAFTCGSASDISSKMPFRGAYLSIVEAVLKLVCAGYGENDINLSLQEYFPEHKNNSTRLGISVASMLGCFEAQMQLGVPSIGGRISIGAGEGDNEKIAIITAFAFCLCNSGSVIGKALTRAASKLVLIKPITETPIMPNGAEIKELIETVNTLKNSGQLYSASVLNSKNAATGLMEMCKAGKKGVVFDPACDIETIFGNSYASVICEIDANAELPNGGTLLGYTCDEYRMVRDDASFDLNGVLGALEISYIQNEAKKYLYLKKSSGAYGSVKPTDGQRVRVLMPMDFCTVSQDDIKVAFEKEGAAVKVLALTENNIGDLVKQLKKADILWLGDSIGDNALVNAVIADKRVKTEMKELCERGGLIYGCGRSFESLIISGMLELDTSNVRIEDTPYINEAVKIIATSGISPFARCAEIGGEYPSYISGKRTKLICSAQYADELAMDGRIAAQYVNSSNVANSDYAIDALSSIDGCVLGQMSRAFCDKTAYPIVRSAIKYFLKL